MRVKLFVRLIVLLLLLAMVSWLAVSRGPAQHIFNSFVIIFLLLFIRRRSSVAELLYFQQRTDWLTACRPFIRLTSFHISLELAMNFIFIIHFHAQMYARRAHSPLFYSSLSVCLASSIEWCFCFLRLVNSVLGHMPPHPGTDQMTTKYSHYFYCVLRTTYESCHFRR